MGVNLGAAGVAVPEQLLAYAILHVALGQFGAVQVAQGVWVQLVGGDAGTQAEAANHGMQAAGGEAAALSVVLVLGAMAVVGGNEQHPVAVRQAAVDTF